MNKTTGLLGSWGPSAQVVGQKGDSGGGCDSHTDSSQGWAVLPQFSGCEFLGCFEAGLSMAVCATSFLNSISCINSCVYCARCFPSAFSNACVTFTVFLMLKHPKETNTKIK